MNHQFKPGDKVRVGKTPDNDIMPSATVVKDGATGVVSVTEEDGACRVSFNLSESHLLPHGVGPWWINPRRLTLVDEMRAEPIEPAAPLPIMARDMTLHDWFAGQALAGLVQNSLNTGETVDMAESIATAMMERRAK